ncbi:dioxygenase family protein [Pseudomonas azerbaijanoccidentalis]|jgi:protocatechuate 3,4-dioxygenase beta subunit
MNKNFGRKLEIGPTDRTSEQRTPESPLFLIPEAARESFVPYVTDLPVPRAGENDLTRIAPGRPLAEGDRIEVFGRICDERGRPIRGALMEIWNANKWGRYTHVDDPARQPLDPNFIGIGRVMSDDNGEYRFWTIEPGAYLARPDIGRWRPKHVHMSLLGGSARLVTQMYFPGDELLKKDPSFYLLGDAGERHIAVENKSDQEGFKAAYQFNIVVGGRNATYFENE